MQKIKNSSQPPSSKVWDILTAKMEQQKEKYTCPKCGGIISIHDRECSECQEKMK